MDQLILWQEDEWLYPYRRVITERHRTALLRYHEIAGYNGNLYDAINSHLYYGCHIENGVQVFREWAPGATALYLIGDINGWKKDEKYRFSNIGNGNWELKLCDGLLPHASLYKWFIEWPGGGGERIPAYATSCVQDSETKLFSARIWNPQPYKWKNPPPPRPSSLLIYEAHIGMSSEKEEVASYSHFTRKILPMIAHGGYNTLQLMAIQEHPYYGSFGYQVSNFFAPSSRFGTPDELKELIDSAHGMGIYVILDIVHSHAVKNVLEGLSQFDGTSDLYFHSGERGEHPAWNSRCFDYGKDQVLRFLLSNCKYWLEEYRFDGFRFDGITSMIYFDHGLGKAFTDYSTYYDGNQDVDALTYLTLANILIKQTNQNAITIAEDVSGMPGLAAPFDWGGVGFDYRMSMGVADNWIKWIKELRDEDWNMGQIYFELTNKRADEKTVSYAECHDQALVGDKTIIFRLIDKEMYYSMSINTPNILVDRGIALHKMIRLVTLATAGGAYLNFMGNEFGHPEWIDFPREGNNWSYFYARRQWSLALDKNLRYKYLLAFDNDIIKLATANRLLETAPRLIFDDNNKQVLVFSRAGIVFAFNFNPVASFTNYQFEAEPGKYSLLLDSDSPQYGGFGRNNPQILRFTQENNGRHLLSLYLPSRCVLVLKREN